MTSSELELPLSDEYKTHLSRLLVFILFLYILCATTQAHSTTQPQSGYSTNDSIIFSQISDGYSVGNEILYVDQTTQSMQAPLKIVFGEQVPRRLTEIQQAIVPPRSRNPVYDQKYEGQYFRSGELNLSPQLMITRANWWMHGEYSISEKQGCFGDPVDGSQYQIATWLYPCGTIVAVINPITGTQVLAEVTDRGPNRLLSTEGWENDRIRKFGVDITPAVAASIGQQPGEVVHITPVKLPLGFGTGPTQIDLVTSPQGYRVIDPLTGKFVG